MDVTAHYDKLIEENNDPFRDPSVLQDYMNQWDGQRFIDAMKLNNTKKFLKLVLEQEELLKKLFHIVLNLQE